MDEQSTRKIVVEFIGGGKIVMGVVLEKEKDLHGCLDPIFMDPITGRVNTFTVASVRKLNRSPRLTSVTFHLSMRYCNPNPMIEMM